jgi:hypothetical protein
MKLDIDNILYYRLSQWFTIIFYTYTYANMVHKDNRYILKILAMYLW